MQSSHPTECILSLYDCIHWLMNTTTVTTTHRLTKHTQVTQAGNKKQKQTNKQKNHYSCQNIGANTKCLLCKKFHIRIAFSCSNLHDMTNSISEITTLVCMICTSVGKQLHMLPSHITKTETLDLNLRSANKQTQHIWTMCLSVLSAHTRTHACARARMHTHTDFLVQDILPRANKQNAYGPCVFQR